MGGEERGKGLCFVDFLWVFFFLDTSNEIQPGGLVTMWFWSLLISGFQVTITLYGLDGESEPHHLSDPDIPVFERGGVDVFLLSTLFPLGELRSLRLWHDNSGDQSSW